MDSKTISDNFRDEIGNHRLVIAAVFTTYNFEPDFFEQEVIPLILDQNLAYSSDNRIKGIQVREALGEADLPIEVFYDLDMFRSQGTNSPAMEYLHHGIRGERSTFHAKLIFLLLEDKSSGERSLSIGAGSANITGAGWWENIECQHWENIASGYVSRQFLKQIRDDIAWLSARRNTTNDNHNHAMPRIDAFLRECRASNSAEPISYYGLTSLQLGQKKRPAFMKFLLDSQNDQCSYYKRWSLDIISPYFAEKTDFDAHKFFFDDLGVENIRLFLPENDQGEALCQRDYFDKMEEIEGIEWATWSPDLAKTLGLKSPVNRKTHAKIYHFYNGTQSWAFVGSVNFTHRAITDNQEAGFFTKLLPSRVSLLTPLKSSPEKWCSIDELKNEDQTGNEDQSLPNLILVYDWKERALKTAMTGRDSILLNIFSPEGTVAISNITVIEQPTTVTCNPDTIEGLLKGSGFLHVSGVWQSSGLAFSAHKVLAQQTNWTHKPLNLPKLSPQEIMQIYAGLSSAHRNQVIEHLKQRELKAMGILGEVTSNGEYQDQGRQFFAEYAELFHAFRNLRKRLESAWDDKYVNQVDYYLTGRGMDSLPTLYESLFEEGRTLDTTTIYLALLCLVQIYDQFDFIDSGNPSTWRNKCQQKIDEIEQSGQLKLIDDDPERTHKFFQWYKAQFFREYRQLSDEATHEAC